MERCVVPFATPTCDAVDLQQASATTWLNISDADRLDLLQSAPGSSQVVSVVAFQGNIVSPPRYYASLDAGITGGTGFASNLLLQFQVDGGGLTRLQWYHNECDGCDSNRCLDGTVCAQVDSEGSSAPVIMAGCIGTDKYSAPFTSGDPALDLR